MGSTNILDMNNRITALEQGDGGESTAASKTDIATEFNTTTTYTKGVMVYHEGKLYQFDEDHTAGAWIGTDAHETNVSDAILESGGGGGQKTYGSAVDISSYTSAAPYTCPADGIVLLNPGTVSDNHWLQLWTKSLGAVDTLMAQVNGHAGSANTVMTVPVLKGAILYPAAQTGSTTPVVSYIPYE